MSGYSHLFIIASGERRNRNGGGGAKGGGKGRLFWERLWLEIFDNDSISCLEITSAAAAELESVVRYSSVKLLWKRQAGQIGFILPASPFDVDGLEIVLCLILYFEVFPHRP